MEEVANHLKQGKVENQKEMDRPYIAGYNKNREANYITSYTSQATKDSYISKYGTKEASKNSGMEHKKHVSLCLLKLISIEILFNSMDTLIFEFLFVGWSGGCN